MSEIPKVPAMPRHPFDVDEFATLPELLAAAERHEVAVIAAARYGEQRPAREVVDHALAALALGQAVRIQIELSRGATIRDALAHGATLDEIALALDVDPDEVLDDVEEWANAKVHHGAMDRAGRVKVASLVERAGGGAR